MDFTAPTLGGAVKAVLLPHLHRQNDRKINTFRQMTDSTNIEF